MFVFSSECGERNLIGTFEVTVEDGAVVTYQPMDERASAFPGSIDDLPTMGQLVGRAEEARLDAEAVLTLETDPADGHPTLIDIDWLPNAMDDEECYESAGTRLMQRSARSPNPSAGPAWTEPDSYVYVFDAQCGRRVLSGRWEVTVENGKAVDYRSLDSPGSQPCSGTELPTLADLMNQVERARADGDAIVKAFESRSRRRPPDVDRHRLAAQRHRRRGVLRHRVLHAYGLTRSHAPWLAGLPCRVARQG